jgi:hypothetical protein
MTGSPKEGAIVIEFSFKGFARSELSLPPEDAGESGRERKGAGGSSRETFWRP